MVLNVNIYIWKEKSFFAFTVCLVYVPDTKDIKMVCPQRPSGLMGIGTVCPAMICASLMWINSSVTGK